MRSTETTVTFAHPFMLAGFDRQQPGGTYRLVTDEDEIPGLSFVAWRRVATMLHLPAIGATARRHQIVSVDPDELANALLLDERGAPDSGKQ